MDSSDPLQAGLQIDFPGFERLKGHSSKKGLKSNEEAEKKSDQSEHCGL